MILDTKLTKTYHFWSWTKRCLLWK